MSDMSVPVDPSSLIVTYVVTGNGPIEFDLSILSLVGLGVVGDNNAPIDYDTQHRFVTFNSHLPDGTPILLFCAASLMGPPYKLWWFTAPISADIKNYVAAASFTDYNGRAFSIVTTGGTDGVLTDTATGLVVSTSLIYGAIFRGRVYKHQFTNTWRDKNGQPYNDTSAGFSTYIWCGFRSEDVHGVIAPITTRLVGNTDNFLRVGDSIDIPSDTVSGRDPDFIQFMAILPDGSTEMAYYNHKIVVSAYDAKWRLGELRQLNQGVVVDFLGAHYSVVDGVLVDQTGVPFGPFTELSMPRYMYSCYVRDGRILYKYVLYIDMPGLNYFTNDGVPIPLNAIPLDVNVAMKQGVIGTFSPALLPLIPVPSTPPVAPTTLVVPTVVAPTTQVSLTGAVSAPDTEIGADAVYIPTLISSSTIRVIELSALASPTDYQLTSRDDVVILNNTVAGLELVVRLPRAPRNGMDLRIKTMNLSTVPGAGYRVTSNRPITTPSGPLAYSIAITPGTTVNLVWALNLATGMWILL